MEWKYSSIHSLPHQIDGWELSVSHYSLFTPGKRGL